MTYSNQNSDGVSPADAGPDPSHYFNDLGIFLKDQGKLQAAIGCFHKAVERRPDFAEALNNLGNAYKFKGDLDKAVFCYQKALHVNSQYAEAYYNLGILHQDNGNFRDAISCYQKATLIKPDFVDAHFNLGNTFRTLGKLAEATQCYRAALRINSNYTGAYNGLGTVFQEQGKVKEAFTCYQQHMQIRPDGAIEVKASLLLPVICESNESIGNDRKRLSSNIDKLSRKNLRLQDPSKQIGQTNFHLAYHGLNNRQLQEKIAGFYLDASPDLGSQVSPKQSYSRNDGKLKIGIISRYLRGHTIGYLNYGLVKYLDREKFHVTVFGFPGISDDLSADIADAADQTIIVPAQLSPARKVIGRQELDILLYADIGMDPLTYFLAFSRLAPVQCTTWGHPDTTGIPNIDYYLSSVNAEPYGAQAHYTEKLILFNEFPMYCRRPQTTETPVTRRQLDLPEDCHLYACIQSLFKVHPDFDDIIAGILLKDPKGIIVFFEGKHAHWGKLLRERFARRLPEVCRRLRFLKRLPQQDFLAFLQIPDVLLDTPHFSGGYTSLLAFAAGTPIVTWPGEFMRGRLTYAWYKRMGIMDTVAEDFDAYIDIACQLANDGDWRKELRNKIKTRAACLYENLEPTRELENFFQWASRKAAMTGC